MQEEKQKALSPQQCMENPDPLAAPSSALFYLPTRVEVLFRLQEAEQGYQVCHVKNPIY